LLKIRSDLEKFQANLLESVRQMGDMAAARVTQVNISAAAEARTDPQPTPDTEAMIETPTMNPRTHTELQSFLEKVDQFFSEMESWCASENLSSQRTPISISEEEYGHYNTDQLKITTKAGKHIADVTPIGASILGANGRIDIKGPHDKIILVDLDAGGPTTTKSTTPPEDGNPPRTRHFYKGIDTPGWYWIDNRASSRGHKLDRDLFLNLLAEVSDHERN
jgi:hypothetical protein